MASEGGGIFRRRFIPQILATEVVNILKIFDGMHRGYVMHMLLSHYTYYKTDLGQFRATEEILWIAPMFSLLAVPPIGKLFMDRFGRKLSFVVIYLASLLSWIFTLNSVDVFHLYLGMGFAGIARGGTSLVIPVFVAEICNPRIRGRLLTISTVNENIGLIAGFFGAFYGEKIAIIIAIAILSIIFLGSLFFLYESPFFYFKKGKPGEAETSLKYYWNMKNYNNFREDDEFTDYRDNLRRKWDSGMYQYCIAGPSSAFTRAPKPSKKNIYLSLWMGSLPIFTGAYSFMNYLGNLKFREHEYKEDFTKGIITIFILAIVGAKCSALIVDSVGRTSALKISAWLCTIILLFSYLLEFISFTYSMHEVDCVVMGLLAALAFSSNIGLTSAWSTVALELPNDEQRLNAFCLSNGLSFFLEIIVASLFPFLFKAYHFHGFMSVCLLLTIASLVFVKKIVPETQGKWLIN
ncbi:hypothetical protein ACFFRR_004227 [Megaselia abdita]